MKKQTAMESDLGSVRSGGDSDSPAQLSTRCGISVVL